MGGSDCEVLIAQLGVVQHHFCGAVKDDHAGIRTSTSAPEFRTSAISDEKSPAPTGVRTLVVVFQRKASVAAAIDACWVQPHV